MPRMEVLDQPTFKWNHLKVEKLIYFNQLEQLSASTRTRVALRRNMPPLPSPPSYNAKMKSKIYRRAAFAGFIFGPMILWIGLYIGLTVNATAGSLLTLPWVAIAAIAGQAMLELPFVLKLAAFFLSGLIWSGVFSVGVRLLYR